MKNTTEYFYADDFFFAPAEPANGEMIIEDMVPQGLTILAGAPKSCKSWMALDMALAVSSGRAFLGKRTMGCGVLYMALEDREARLKERFHALEEIPSHKLRVMTKAKKLDSGFFKQIHDFLDENPDVRLIIIDTLQMIRVEDASASNVNQYGREYAELSKLKEFADRGGIAILVIHHLRKLHDKNDPLNDILGSTAMTGVADSILILNKERTRIQGELLQVGRDSPQWRMTMLYEDNRWHTLEIETEEDMVKKEIPDILFRIAEMIKLKGGWEGTATQLLKTMGETQMSANTLSAKISQFYYPVFFNEGVIMEMKRTSKERLMIWSLRQEEEAADADIAADERLMISVNDCNMSMEAEDEEPHMLTPEENQLMVQQAMNRLLAGRSN